MIQRQERVVEVPLGRSVELNTLIKFQINEKLSISITTSEWICGPLRLKINEETANYADFGEMRDTNPSRNQSEYGCGNMSFVPKKATQRVLDTYGINLEEYNTIVDILEDELHMGQCALCC